MTDVETRPQPLRRRCAPIGYYRRCAARSSSTGCRSTSHPGRRSALGPSGSGKSTCCGCCRDPPAQLGAIRLHDPDVTTGPPAGGPPGGRRGTGSGTDSDHGCATLSRSAASRTAGRGPLSDRDLRIIGGPRPPDGGPADQHYATLSGGERQRNNCPGRSPGAGGAAARRADQPPRCPPSARPDADGRDAGSPRSSRCDLNLAAAFCDALLVLPTGGWWPPARRPGC